MSEWELGKGVCDWKPFCAATFSVCNDVPLQRSASEGALLSLCHAECAVMLKCIKMEVFRITDKAS